MATLPQASDYGARVGLRSNRVDIPGQGEMAVADALSRAAATFTDMAIQHKQKDDALSYSNAKNEYLIADIQERERLSDDQDFATHDERYRTAMKGHYERLFPTVRSSRDRHLFDSEARLMDERGAVAVGDNSRTKEIDWHVGQFRKNTIAAQGVIMAANDAQTAQDAMFTVLEQGAALRQRGYLTEDQYQAEMQTFVTETAKRRLIAMDPKDREVLLERSITMAKTKGEPITREQIAAGEGSGSIADFLPLDARVAMLETTRKGNEHDATMSTAYGIYDEVLSRYEDPAKVVAALAAAGKGQDADVRTALNTLGVQYRQNAVASEAINRDNIMTAAGAMMDKGKNPETMDQDLWGQLLPAQQSALKKDWINRVQGNGFGKTDTMYTPVRPDDENHILTDDGQILMGEASPEPSYAYWKSIPRNQRAGVNLDTSPWRAAFTQPTWRLLVAEQDQIKKELASGSSASLPGGMSNTAMVTSALVRSGFIPQIGRDIEDSESYQQLLFQMDRATQEAQEAKGSPLTNTERNKILSDILLPVAFTDDYVWWPNNGPDDEVSIMAMSSKQLQTARLDWADSVNDQASISETGIPTSYRQELELMARRLEIKPDQDDYERAYFALKHGHRFGWGSEEVVRRLKNE